jgi:gas vesicle protein GvpN
LEPHKINHDSYENLFVRTPSIENIINKTIQYLKAGFPVHFVGPSGVGKTSLAMYIATQLNRPVSIIRGNHTMSNSDLLGGYFGVNKKEVIDNYIRTVYKKEQEIRPHWINGELLEAVRNGHTLIFDEFTRSKPETNNLLLSVLEEKVLSIYGNTIDPYVKVHPQFSVIFTSNPDEYAGVFATQDALLDRLITIDLDYIDLQTEIEIIHQKTGINIDEAEMIAQFVSEIRSKCLTKHKYGPSLRASIMIANISKSGNIPVDPKNVHFQTICSDILWSSFQRANPDMSKQAIKYLILNQLQMKGGEIDFE